LDEKERFFENPLSNKALLSMEFAGLVLVPGSYSGVGDLAEEFQLRCAADGEPLHSYGAATRSSQRLRNTSGKIERLAAIGTMTDFVSRFFRK
jgi:hypothetical protein